MSGKRGLGASRLARLASGVGVVLSLGACPAVPVTKGESGDVRPDPQELPLLQAAVGLSAKKPLAEAPPAVEPSPGWAWIVLSVRWPERPLQAQSLAPSTDRIKFEVRGPAPAELSIPDLVRPNGGTLAQTVSVSLPVRTGIELRATGFAGTAVVGQSLWTGLPLRPNARIDVPLELLPASGPDLLRAVLLAPRIDAVSPERGYPTTTTVTIRGANFGYSRGLGGVSFGGVDAGEATSWTENAEGATISARLPPGARTGPVLVRVGRADSPQRVEWPPQGSGGSGDPWKGRFTVLGPAGEPFGIDSGKIVDFKTAFDGTQRNFWVVWTREGGKGIQLMASVFSAGAQPISTLALQGTVRVAESAGLQLGGIATDATGIWMTWQETTQIGSRVMFGHLAANATLTDRVAALSTTPANPALPVIARNPKDSQMLAAWIDNRESEGIYQRPRIYTQILSPTGQCGSIAFDPDRGFYVTTYAANCPGTVNPAQESNKKGVISNLSRVGGLTAASNGSTFLVGWHETVTDSFSLRFQRFGSKGVRHFSEIAGTQEGGPSDTEFLNPSLPGSRRSLEEPQLLWNDTEKEYLVTYVSRIGSEIGRSSDVYVHRLDDFGKEVAGNQPQIISDDTRGNQGQPKCPTFDPGIPCGQGLRTKPQVAWNGRDYMLAWQLERDDGEVDIYGARLQRTAQGTLIRAPEEPPSPQPFSTLPRSVAEIIFSFMPTGGYGQTLAGAQTMPRLVWGGDVLIVGWIEPKDGSSVLAARLWR